MDMPETQVFDQGPVEVFPRLKERDPYKRLGLGNDASFEEVQEARNFLYDQYSQHEPSRESIELAFDTILQQKMKVRHRFGFRPPTRGKYGEAKGDELKQSIWQIIRSKFEPSVPSTTLVNDGSIFLALGLWAAWQAASSDPTLPIGAALCFCAWKLYDKRNKRNPDGPYLGGSPIWGALGSTIFSLLMGAVVSFGLVQILPLPARITGEAAGLFFTTISLGLGCIFLK
jgi:ATP-dependent HslUV protease ATP-binding subunit HslU